MRVKVFQINTDRDVNSVKYQSMKMLNEIIGKSEVDPSIYDEVFDGELDTSNLEEIFRMFNHSESYRHAGHPLFRGHSLSVSDVVVMEDRAHFCQPVGFQEVEFDTSKTQKPDNLIKVVYVEPNKEPYIAEVENSLDGLQRAVDGLIEPIFIEDDETCLIGNEEAKLIGMEGNRRIGDGSSIIAGPFFVVGVTDDGFRGLTDEEVEKYMDRYEEPEMIDQADVEADTGFIFYSGM